MFVMPAAALAQVAPAEEAPGATQGLEDIVVTARRQSESLLNVPVAVSAISRDTLERARVNDLQNIAELAPNVMIASTNNGAAISVRGVGTAGFDPGFDQSVASPWAGARSSARRSSTSSRWKS
jgi:iron complex outermembrane receptor protein